MNTELLDRRIKFERVFEYLKDKSIDNPGFCIPKEIFDLGVEFIATFFPEGFTLEYFPYMTLYLVECGKLKVYEFTYKADERGASYSRSASDDSFNISLFFSYIHCRNVGKHKFGEDTLKVLQSLNLIEGKAV